MRLKVVLVMFGLFALCSLYMIGSAIINFGKLFDRHANMKYKFGNRKFWAEGHCVSTVGLNEATIAKYIREQEKADIALDRLSAKEYEDPFDRGPGRK